MAAGFAVTGSMAWLPFFEVSWLSWGEKIDPQRVPGEVKIDPWRVPGGSWRPLGSSGGLLGAVAGVLESSRSRLGGVLGPKGSHFGALVVLLFGDTF